MYERPPRVLTHLLAVRGRHAARSGEGRNREEPVLYGPRLPLTERRGSGVIRTHSRRRGVCSSYAMTVTTSEVRIGHDRVFLALSDEHDGVSTRSSRGSLENVHALLALPHLRAETQVHLADASLERDLASFFGGLAEDWRGWEGARAWAT